MMQHSCCIASSFIETCNSKQPVSCGPFLSVSCVPQYGELNPNHVAGIVNVKVDEASSGIHLGIP